MRPRFIYVHFLSCLLWAVGATGECVTVTGEPEPSQKNGSSKTGGLQTPTAQEIAAAEQKPVSIRVKKFSGLLIDISGAAVSGGNITIVRTHATGSTGVTQIKSGDDGRFSTQLPVGFYVAFFRSNGFRTETVSLKIGNDGSTEWRVPLRPGAC